MKFEAGHEKVGGRKKGTPNRLTENLEIALAEMNLDPVAILTRLMPKLPPEKQADIALNLMGYLYPRRKAIEINPREILNERVKQMSDEELIAGIPAAVAYLKANPSNRGG